MVLTNVVNRIRERCQPEQPDYMVRLRRLYTVKVVCAWCAHVLVDGPELPLSHGMCDDCFARERAKLELEA